MCPYGFDCCVRQAVRVATHYASVPCKLTISSHLFARWHLFRHDRYLRHQQQVDLLTLKVVSESRVTWATSVPIVVFLGLCSRIRPDVHDRQTSDVRQKHRLMPPLCGGGGIIMPGRFFLSLSFLIACYAFLGL